MPLLDFSNQRIKPTCGNCIHSYFYESDLEEIQRCRLVGRFYQGRINLEAKFVIENILIGKNIGFCEYHEPPKRLKTRIDYKLLLKGGNTK